MIRIFAISICFIAHSVFAQTDANKLEKLRAKGEVETAIRFIETKGVQTANGWNQVGLLFWENNLNMQADAAFNSAISLDASNAPFSLEVAHAHVDVLRKIGRSDEANTKMSELARSFPESKIATLWMGFNMSQNSELGSDLEIRAIDSLNSDFDDFGLFQWKDYWIFSSNRPIAKGINSSRIQNDAIHAWNATSNGPEYFSLSQTERVEDFSMNVGLYTLSSDVVFYTKNDSKNRKGVYQSKIFYRWLEDKGVWGAEQTFPFNSNNHSLGQTAWDEKRKRLYYTTNEKGTLGGTDIYYSDWSNGTWTMPVPLAVVNTEGDEMFPVVSGDTLYFSSSGFPGIGGLDILLLDIQSQKWYLMNDLNSQFDDFAPFFESNLKGWLSSTRPSNKKGDNLFQFEVVQQLKPELNVIAVEMSTSGTKGQLDGIFSLDSDFADLQMSINKGSMSKSYGLAISLPALYYGFEQFELSLDEKKKLGQIAEVLRKQPELHIIIKTHADCLESESRVAEQSSLRLGYVEAYLLANGVQVNQFYGEALGAAEPAMPCEMECSVCPDDIRWANRRTEFIVTNQPQAFAPSLPAAPSVREEAPPKVESSVAMIPLVPAKSKANEVPVKAAPAKAQPVIAPTSGAVACYLVTGSFKTKALAVKRVLELNGQGYSAQTMEVNGMFRVVLPLPERPNDAELDVYRQRLGKVWVARP
jgi:outer membrane protein OmpA-like peptidoglycan-associated protein